MRDDYYEILGLQRDATAREIVRAFRRASLKVHPDKVVLASEAEQLWAAESFAALREAYDTLSDPKQRERYDQRAKWMSSHPDQVRPATCNGILLGADRGLMAMAQIPPRAATAGTGKAQGRWDRDARPSPSIGQTTRVTRAPSRGASRGASRGVSGFPGLSWGAQPSRNLSRPGSRASGAESLKLDPLRMVRVQRPTRNFAGSANSHEKTFLPLESIESMCRLERAKHGHLLATCSNPLLGRGHP
mmetsp:Transcript_7715/g.16381  ORF Transcript_7715/g.16381 Transcript_7715/m.16381 type:complete len:246 (+) Transcript_7715:68-805(+)